jgi:hypothetical protein
MREKRGLTMRKSWESPDETKALRAQHNGKLELDGGGWSEWCQEEGFEHQMVRFWVPEALPGKLKTFHQSSSKTIISSETRRAAMPRCFLDFPEVHKFPRSLGYIALLRYVAGKKTYTIAPTHAAHFM